MATTTRLRFSRPLKDVHPLTASAGDDSPTPSAGGMPAELAAMFDPATPKVLELLQEIPALVQELESRRLQMIDEFRQLAVELAVAIASKLTYREIQQDENFIGPILEQVLSGWDQNTHWTLSFNPKDFENLERHKQKLEPTDGEILKLQSDPSIPQGDFRLETPSSYFVSSIQTKLTEIRQMIMKDLSHVTVERRSHENLDQRIRRFPDRRSGL